MLGNGLDGKHGWWGEIHGLAVFDRTLNIGELERLQFKVADGGLASIIDAPGIVMLVPGSGNDPQIADDLIAHRAGTNQAILIPDRFAAMGSVLRTLPLSPFPPDPATYPDLILNVLLFLPFGWVAASLSRQRTGLPAVLAGLGIVIAGATLSLGLEAQQLLIPSRSPGTSDILTNTIGTLIGVGCHHWLKWPRPGND